MPKYTTLPVADSEYSQQNEQVARRSIEQSLQDISTTVEGNTNKTNKDSSLALRRFQFLLMGASNA